MIDARYMFTFLDSSGKGRYVIVIYKPVNRDSTLCGRPQIFRYMACRLRDLLKSTGNHSALQVEEARDDRPRFGLLDTCKVLLFRVLHLFRQWSFCIVLSIHVDVMRSHGFWQIWT